MAAICACCGAEITLKAEACPACGTPRHGMLKPGALLGFEFEQETAEEKPASGETLLGGVSCRRDKRAG